MIHDVLRHVRHPIAFGFGVIVGVLGLLLVQLALPARHYERIYYQNGDYSFQSVISIDPWTNKVTWLANSNPRLEDGPPVKLRPGVTAK